MKKSILIVDDEPLIRWALYEGLKDRFTVVTAESVDHAIRILETMAVDAVVTGTQMSVWSGTDLVDFVRAKHPGTKIVLIPSGIPERFFSAQDVDGRLQKPFDVRTLRAFLESRLCGANNVA